MLTIAGIGPGKREGMTEEVLQALAGCDCIAGYTVYVELVRKIFPDKAYYTTPMTQETARCEWAIAQARAGRDVVVVCGGDSGVYGMAGLILELLEEAEDCGSAEAAEEERRGRGAAEAGEGGHGGVALRILPGVTAALSGAAVLGAPLAHDFVLISLSDRLTPWAHIEKRLAAAAAGDFVICLYNPASKGRPDHLRRACDVLLQSGGVTADRLCGIVRNIGRDGQERRIMTLGELRDYPADMFTTVYIGSSETRKSGAYLVTPRGYHSRGGTDAGELRESGFGDIE